MITLALDTATNRCSVALTNGTDTVSRYLDGARHHAGALLPMVDQCLQQLELRPDQIERVITADGPGSFTGLRVGIAVAKALVWQTGRAWYTTPSLLVRAWAHTAGAGRVVAVSNALRGQLYAAGWQIRPDGVELISGPPCTVFPEELNRYGMLDVLVGSVPEELRLQVEKAAGTSLIGEPDSLPEASALLQLVDLPGGAQRISVPTRWEPEYGRPAEAQAVWERKHGQPLPDPPYLSR